jgi:hypothetical protein
MKETKNSNSAGHNAYVSRYLFSSDYRHISIYCDCRSPHSFIRYRGVKQKLCTKEVLELLENYVKFNLE